MSIYNGDTVRVKVSVYGPTNALVNPTTIQLKIIRADTSTITYSGASVVQESTGKYYVDVPITNLPGRWKWRWEATGANAAAEEGGFDVNASSF
jgi:hypothetical protein